MTHTGDKEERRAFSPSALNRFLACEHRTYLDILERRGEMKGCACRPTCRCCSSEVTAHEDAVVDRLVAEGRDVVALED